MHRLADLRTEYSKLSLDSTSVAGDPVAQFTKWFDEAISAGVTEPNAMHLATVNDYGRPSSRIVLLKGIEEGKFQFYTNYHSRKGKEIENNPACALTFFWPELERQVRIEGTAHRVEEALSDAYFKSRPRGSQVGAWSSPQSTIISDRSILEARTLEIEKKFEGQETLPRPHQWGGFQVEPVLIEFWQGRPSRLHDRIIYALVDGKWEIGRLAP